MAIFDVTYGGPDGAVDSITADEYLDQGDFFDFHDANGKVASISKALVFKVERRRS